MLAPTQLPTAAANAFSPWPAKGGVWPARGAGGGQAGEIPSFSPLASENGFQELGSWASRTSLGWTTIARYNSFVGLSGETKAREGLESRADLGLEMLQRCHLQCFTVMY